MRACLALCVAAVLVGAASAECGACIQGACYRKHLLSVPGEGLLLQDIDRNRNILYLTDKTTLRMCYLETDLCETTNHTWKIRQLAVDQSTGDIYGLVRDIRPYSLYKFDLVNNERKDLVRWEVVSLAFKDKLYFTKFNGIYTIENGNPRELVKRDNNHFVHENFIVDKNDDIYFRTMDDRHLIITKLSNGVVDQNVQWGVNYYMTVDKDGDAMVINKESRVMYKVVDGQLNEIGAIADPTFYYYWYERPLFDKDNNLIYRSGRKTFLHLKRDSEANCTYSISRKIAIITETTGVSTTPHNIDTTASEVDLTG